MRVTNAAVTAKEKPRDGEQEHIQVLDDGLKPNDVELSPPDDLSRSQVVANALEKNEEIDEKADVRYYRVEKGGPILTANGFRTVLKEGKIIDNLNYDVIRIQQQGIRIMRIENPDSTQGLVY